MLIRMIKYILEYVWLVHNLGETLIEPDQL